MPPTADEPVSPGLRIASILRLVVGFVYMMTVSLAFIAVTIPLLPWRGLRIRAGNLCGKVLGRGILFIAGVKPVIRNRERLAASFPAIYVENHVSTLDAFAGMWLCPFGGCGVAKKEIAKTPFFGQVYYLTGHLLLDRDNRGSAVSALARTAEVMRRLRLGAWMWPEGTRSADGRLRPTLKKGFAHLALATGLPIVPVVVHDAHKAWRKHALTFHPMTMYIDVLPPIDTRSWRAETIDEHVALVHRTLAAGLGPEQRPLGWEEARRQEEPAALERRP
ncbi:1-acyl-sn-glycerol-3-phosphate acyltransferase [Myxococcota bacterium]|nr:1-acyl-sn-glycerol-3-phosphate acyltransferase [Myxococcota bacterium]